MLGIIAVTLTSKDDTPAGWGVPVPEVVVVGVVVPTAREGRV